MGSIDNIPKFNGNFKDLISSISNLRYDKLSEFYLYLSINSKNRNVSDNLFIAYKQMKKIWRSCENYDNSKHPTYIKNYYGTMYGLTELISDSDPLELKQFYFSFANEIVRQSKNDARLEHSILSKRLKINSKTLSDVFISRYN